MTTPRVAVFCTTFLSYSETFIYDEVSHHTRWQADIFCKRRENIERFPYATVHVPTPGLDRALYQMAAYAPSFERILRDGRHRVLHAHFGTNAVYALPLSHRLRRPFVVTFHGFDVSALTARLELSPWFLRYRALANRIFARAALLLCPSIEVQDIIARASRRPDATRLHRLGIDLSRFSPTTPDRQRPRVVMIGRFVEKKGHIDGIEAFGRAVLRGVDAELVIVGEGPLEGAYRERIATLGLGTRVDLAGVRTTTEIAQLLAASDVLLAPSKVASNGDRESGLIVAKEASASALPVIGTRHGGIPEIVDHGVTGYLTDEGDVATLAERLEELCRDSDLRVRMGKAGRLKMEREYDVRERVAELERLYDEVD